MQPKKTSLMQPSTHHAYWAMFLAVSLGVTTFLLGQINQYADYVEQYANVDLRVPVAKAATTATLSLSPSSNTVAINQNFNVNIMLDTGGSDTDGVDIYALNYNPSILQVVDSNSGVAGVQIAPASLLPNNVINTVDNTAGTVKYSQSTSGGSSFNGSGILATITFRAIASGTSAVTFDFTAGATNDSNVAYQGVDELASVTNGSFTVDGTAPTVSITAPANGATVSGTVSVTANASDTGSGVAGVQFKLDGANLGAEDTSSAYSTSWNSGAASNGTHTLTAVARDNAGNNTTSSSISVTVNNIDFSMSNGGNKSVTQGSAVTNSITATAVTGSPTVSYSASGLPTGASASFSPTTCVPTCTTTMTISTSGSTPAGNSTVTVTGTGGSVTRTTSFTLTVGAAFDFTLGNGGNKSVTQGASTTNSVTATLSSGSATSVSFSASGLPSGASSSFSPTSCAATCSTTMTINTSGSTPTGNSTITVSATGGSATHTSSFTLTVNAVADTTAPTVSVTGPSNGATISGSSVTVTATASDAGSGMAGVQFKVDTTNIGLEDTTSPYSVTLNTTSINDGTHTISAVARDVAGNLNTSTITVTVSNNVLPQGTFDQVTTDGIIRGWTFDPDDSSSSNQVKIYIDGTISTGTLAATITANVDRADIRSAYGITGNHGFNFTIPATYQNGGYHSVYVYGVDFDDTSKTILLGSSPQNFTVRNVSLTPEARSSKVISGTLSVLNASKSTLIDIPFTTSSTGNVMITLQVPAQAAYFKVRSTPFLTRVFGVDLTQTSSLVSIPQLFTGDINQDNIINSIDYSVLNTNWFSAYAPADLNQDGVVNSIDYSYMNKHWLVNGEQ